VGLGWPTGLLAGGFQVDRVPARHGLGSLGGHEGHQAGSVEGGVLAAAQLVELGDPLLGGGVADDDDPPGLTIATGRSEPRAVEQLVEDVVG
jgi:hypothetical protein